jgi:uncharacterized repeat protein (TIGR01451 family)
MLAAMAPAVAAAGGLIQATPASASVPSAVTDVNPNSLSSGTLFGGRTEDFAVNPINPSIVFAATQLGGLWKSTNSGHTWSHVDAVPLTNMQDVKFAPADANLVIATGGYDGSIDNRGGGIWRSTDGGTTWAKAPNSDQCNPVSANGASKIGFAPDGTPGNITVFVALPCGGFAKSTDSGSTWSGIPAPSNNRIWDVSVRGTGPNYQVDACGSVGFIQSTDGGSTWPTQTPWTAATFPHPTGGTPPAPQNPGSPCDVTTVPQSASTLFMATVSPVPGVNNLGETYLFDSTDGGVNWHNLNVSSDSNGQPPWVQVTPSFGGNANQFEVFYGTDQIVMHNTCDITATPICADGTDAGTSQPGPSGSPSGSWNVYDGGIRAVHNATDPAALAIDPNTGCPFLEGGDPGIFYTTNGCTNSPTWVDGNTGLHALFIYMLAGTASSGHTDVYYGMQDNGQYCSNDGATTWYGCSGADVFQTYADLTGPPSNVLYNADNGYTLANEDLTSPQSFKPPIGTTTPPKTNKIEDPIAQFGNQSYGLIAADTAQNPTCTLYVTTNAGSNWTTGPALPGCPSPMPGLEQPIVASGPSSSPTFYMNLTVNNAPTLYRLSGPVSTTSTLVPLTNGMANPTVFNVNPVNPLDLYAVDTAGSGAAKFSTDGGASWQTGTTLTSLVTDGGVYPFDNAAGGDISAFGFDPASSTVVAGTNFTGVFASTDNGAHWISIPGTQTQQTPRISGFFFDTNHPGTVYIGTAGRGALRLVLPAADLSITKTSSPNPVTAGQQLTYTLTVTNSNTSASTAGLVSVTDNLPSQVTFLTSSDGCTQGPPGQLSCPVPDLNPGDTFTFTVTVLVNSNAIVNTGGAGTITNNATVSSGDSIDPNPADNTVSDTTTVVDSADLAVTKLCKPDTTIYAGTPINCTVFVDNNGPSDARSVTIDDTTLANGAFTITNVAVNPGPTNCTVSAVTGGQDIKCQAGNLAAASTTQTGRVTLTYTVTANDGMNIDDVATASSPTPDPNLSNNQAQVNLTVTALADLGLTKNGPATATAGVPNGISWTLQASNSGPSAATNVVITDDVPAGVTITGVTMPGATCSSGTAGNPAQPTVCNVGTLASGATSSTMTVTATINPQTTGVLENDARVSSDTFDGNTSNNLASTFTTVVVKSSIAVTIAATPNPVVAGTPLSYQLTVSNGGPSTATGVTLTDPLPAGVSFTSVSGAGICGYQTNTNTVTCTLPNLDPGQSVNVYIATTVKSSTPGGPMTNGCASPPGPTCVVATANGSPNGYGSVTTTVTTSADLAIVLTSDANVYKPSTTIHYTITVNNLGPSDAQQVVITQLLPPVKQGKYISNNIGCAPPSGTTLTCQAPAVPALATIPAGGSVTFQVNFFITGNKGTITSTAQVVSSTTDPISSNNSSTRVVTVK